VLGLLLDRGVDVNQRYDNDLTTLMWAAAYGRDAAVKLLLERGADVSAHDNRGKTAADMAAEGGHRRTLESLRRNAS
jgi:ankyrin repeat protein